MFQEKGCYTLHEFSNQFWNIIKLHRVPLWVVRATAYDEQITQVLGQLLLSSRPVAVLLAIHGINRVGSTDRLYELKLAAVS